MLVSEVRRLGIAGRTTIQSFDWRTLEEARRIAPEIPTVCLTARQRWLDTVETGPDLQVFHAGTARRGSDIVTSGGRVLGVTGLGTTVADARDRAYGAVRQIRWEGCRYRKDIAAGR